MTTPHKAVFITGAAAGIGRAVALRFAAAGYFVGLSDIQGEAVSALTKELGPSRAWATALDVSNAEAFRTALAKFVAHTGHLDVLVNNAGVLRTGSFASQPMAQLHAMLDINAKGVVNGCHAAHVHLKAGGRVINLASASALHGTPEFSVYSATKFFVRGLTEALNLEWAGQGIAVSDISPLFVATGMVKDLSKKPSSIGRLGVHLTADDVAKVVIASALSNKPRCHYYPGIQTKAFAMLVKVSPSAVNRWATKLVAGI